MISQLVGSLYLNKEQKCPCCLMGHKRFNVPLSYFVCRQEGNYVYCYFGQLKYYANYPPEVQSKGLEFNLGWSQLSLMIDYYKSTLNTECLQNAIIFFEAIVLVHIWKLLSMDKMYTRQFGMISHC